VPFSLEGHRVSSHSLSLDVVSDVVCPWCYIGKRRLGAALDLVAAEGEIAVARPHWRPFELNPGLPPEGVDRREYLEAKFGGLDRAAQRYEVVRAAGASAGIAFEFDRIKRVPNTRDAHRLIEWAQARGDAAPLVERLFAAFFVEGRNVGDRAELANIAGEEGLDADAARAMLASNEGSDAVEEGVRWAQDVGIGGVPFFIFGGRFAVSGAQDPRVLASAIAEAARVAAT
jgi:predicted DsbA family dithiol-disulfide isomerase